MKKSLNSKNHSRRSPFSVAASIILAALLVCAALLPGCAGTGHQGKIRLLATVFPFYDWAREVAKDVDNVEISLLVGNGADIHSYVPGVSDVAAISTCDIIVYAGGESDEWVKDALKNVPAGIKKPVEVTVSEVPGVTLLAEEIKEGMQEPAEEHDRGDGDHAHGDGEGFDEHLWLSFENAKAAVKSIASALSGKDPENAGKYTGNAEKYCSSLDSLKESYAAAVKAADTKVLFFGDRFPFLYLTREFGLDYYAPFVGCSAETEVSPSTIVFLKEKAAELGVSKVIVLPGSSRKIADTVMSETAHARDYTLLTLDPMQQTPAKDAGANTYISVMEANLRVLSDALSKS